jgi:cholesterol transport system auxiliary component
MTSIQLRVWMVASAVGLSACSSLLPSPAPTPSFYTLSSGGGVAQPAGFGMAQGPTLVVNPVRAAAGFDSAHIVYTRSPPQLEHFARSEWADTPARMLAPWMVEVLGRELTRTGAAGAVLLAPTPAVSDFMLDTDLVRLQQDFSTPPSRVRLTLRVSLIQTSSRRVLAVREFDATEPAPSDDPRGGVQAAQAASAKLLQEVSEFCRVLMN